MREFDIIIRQSQKDELDMLHSEFSPDSLLKIHHRRHEIQVNGEGLYLIAWYDMRPVGHLLLRWKGPDRDPSSEYPYPTPYLEGIGTVKPYRRKGIATKIIQNAEYMIQERGMPRSALTVGSDDNPHARHLYEKLGYKDWGQGEFSINWEYKNKDGNEGIETEVCIYMFKDL
jgi:GNAT superfamily N-acetyltransferase